MYIPKKYVHDFIIYLQKEYNIYNVEFREVSGNRRSIVIANSLRSATLWICIREHSLFKASVHIVSEPSFRDCQRKIEKAINDGIYKNYGSKFTGEWLPM